MTSTVLALAELRADVRARLRRLRDRPGGTRARLRVLEEEVQEGRQLNRRVAELADVVAELLVPLQQADPEQADEIIERYRSSL